MFPSDVSLDENGQERYNSSESQKTLDYFVETNPVENRVIIL